MCPGCIVSLGVAATLWTSGKTIEALAQRRRDRALAKLEEGTSPADEAAEPSVAPAAQPLRP